MVAAFGHREALEWNGEWASVEVVLVDAADEGREGDQFPGVAVVRRIREAGGGTAGPTVIVVTGHTLHDGLRHRMKQAGADFFFARADLRTRQVLIETVLHPERHRRGVPEVADPDQRRILGVGDAADVEALVGYVEGEQLAGALDPDRPSREDPRSRRWLHHRHRMSETAGIEPVNMTTGDRPRGQEAPSIRQLSRVWAWAARIRRQG